MKIAITITSSEISKLISTRAEYFAVKTSGDFDKNRIKSHDQEIIDLYYTDAILELNNYLLNYIADDEDTIDYSADYAVVLNIDNFPAVHSGTLQQWCNKLVADHMLTQWLSMVKEDEVQAGVYDAAKISASFLETDIERLRHTLNLRTRPYSIRTQPM